MPRKNSTTWNIGDNITAAREQNFNQDIDDLYANGSDRGRIWKAASGTALKIDIAAFAYRIGGVHGQYAGGADITVTDATTNYVEVDTSGVININTSGWDGTSLKGRLGTVVCAGGVVTSISMWKPDITDGALGLSATMTVNAKTADYTVVSGDSTYVFTNAGASGDVQLTLPTAATGLNNTYACTVAQNLVIRAVSADTFNNGTTAVRGLYSNSPYSSIQIIAPAAGAWFVTSLVGTWTSIFSKGYWAGGYVTGGSTSTTIGGFRFDTEAFADISATLDTSRGGVCGGSSSKDGYIMGGDTGSPSAVVSKTKFFNESEANIAGTLTTAVKYGAGCFSSTKAYIMGGDQSGTKKNTIGAVTFSSDGVSQLSATLGAATKEGSGGQSSTKGYIFGGDQGSPEKIIYALTYSGETEATVVTQLASNLSDSGTGCSSTKAYIAGGFIAAVTNVIQAFVFSGETISTLAATLGTARNGVTGIASSTKAYFGGGNNGATYYTAIDALVFSGETSSVLSAVFSAGRSFSAGLQSTF